MKYMDKKAQARQDAIAYQMGEYSQVSFMASIGYKDGDGLSYGELAEVQAIFERLGKRYGLLKEFKENCII